MVDYVKLILVTPLFVMAFWGIELMATSLNREKIKQNLAFFMLCGFIASGSGVAFFLEKFELYRAIYVPVVFFALSQFPSFYVYIHSLTREEAFSSKIYLHYLYPLFAMLVAVGIHWFWFKQEDNMLFVSKYLTGHKIDVPKFRIAFIVDRIFKDSFIIFGFFYYWLINRRVKRHREKIENYFSYSEGINLKWISVFNVLLFMTLASGVFFHAVNRQLFVEQPSLLTITYGTLTLFFWTIGHSGSRQGIIYPPNSAGKVAPEMEEKETGAFQPLSDDFKKYLEGIMKNERPYLQTDLSLPELTKLTGTNRTYLSKFINDTYGQNFKQFVNEFRLNEAKRILQSPEYSSLSMMSISSKCGFSSYHTFIRCFKDKYGVTPSIFREQSLGTTKHV